MDIADIIPGPFSALNLFHHTNECFSGNMEKNQGDKKWAVRPTGTKTGRLQMCKLLATASKHDTAGCC